MPSIHCPKPIWTPVTLVSLLHSVMILVQKLSTISIYQLKEDRASTYLRQSAGSVAMPT